jgi:hypothetical protein
VSWTVKHSNACIADIRRVHYEDAQSILGAVGTFALRGTGRIKIISDRTMLVFARGGYAMVDIDERAKKLYVYRIVADDPLPYVVPLLDRPAPLLPDHD